MRLIAQLLCIVIVGAMALGLAGCGTCGPRVAGAEPVKCRACDAVVTSHKYLAATVYVFFDANPASYPAGGAAGYAKDKADLETAYDLMAFECADRQLSPEVLLRAAGLVASMLERFGVLYPTPKDLGPMPEWQRHAVAMRKIEAGAK